MSHNATGYMLLKHLLFDGDESKYELWEKPEDVKFFNMYIEGLNDTCSKVNTVVEFHREAYEIQ